MHDNTYSNYESNENTSNAQSHRGVFSKTDLAPLSQPSEHSLPDFLPEAASNCSPFAQASVLTAEHPALAKYTDLQTIGAGGQGTMLRATAPDGTKVAIKVFDIQKADSLKSLELFEREIETLKHINVRGVPKFIRDIRTDRYLYLVEDYIAAPSLEMRMQNGERFTFKQILTILENSAKILDELANLVPPVIHRDIKPANLLVDDNLNVTLVDFGAVARKVQESCAMTFAGTAGYLPLEQINGKATTASDIYSLGVTIAHLVTGKAPCDMMDDDMKLNIDKYIPSNIPKWFVIVLHKMIDPHPTKRLQNGKQVIDYLKSPSIPQNKSGISHKKTIIIASSLIIFIVIAIIVGVSSYNNAIEMLEKVITQEKLLIKAYPNCSETKDIKDRLLGKKKSNLYSVTPYEFVPETYSTEPYHNRLLELGRIEQECKILQLQATEAQKILEERQKAEAEKKKAEAELIKIKAERELAEQKRIDAELKRIEAERILEEQKMAQDAALEESVAAPSKLVENTNQYIPNSRLRPDHTLKFNKYKHISWLIFYDTQLNRPCHVITNSKYVLMQKMRWCIPFSGKDEDLNDTFANSIAMDYPLHKACKNDAKDSDFIPPERDKTQWEVDDLLDPSHNKPTITRQAYCNEMFNALKEQAERENWASLAEICRKEAASNPQIKEYCDYLF